MQWHNSNVVENCLALNMKFWKNLWDNNVFQQAKIHTGGLPWKIYWLPQFWKSVKKSNVIWTSAEPQRGRSKNPITFLEYFNHLPPFQVILSTNLSININFSSVLYYLICLGMLFKVENKYTNSLNVKKRCRKKYFA